ncbi:hypothetical protein SeMB42_g07079 [Synchytrium endobioticum]|uniref:Geranylgeranyl transferase type-2 subunit beta n=1 Tax=Synchytrium endobioticum TaxID=286115 RepID=A0A507CB73_9FUNG|nr:hypothetical protein SeMB42_g07079 [Synchytrium endobioticum]TPX42530.1 hypothetical protein SeLEV6574_g05545 [Synchytrium endobioticum]
MARLLTALHVKYITELDNQRHSFEYWASAHIRMNGVYWGITALDLLGHPDALTRSDLLHFVRSCYHPNGAFGGAPFHDPHLLPTLSAIQILATLDALHELPDKDKTVSYLTGLQANDGSFHGDEWGETDSRFVYSAILALSLLGSLHTMDVDRAVAYILRCRNFDGGFGSVPGAESHAGQIFCCVNALSIVDRIHLIDDEKLGWWLAERQLKNGGLNGRPEKLEDVCYSWWVLSSMSTLGKVHWIDRDKLVQFILSAQDDETGGFADRPEDLPDLFHTVFGLAGLSLLGYEGLAEVDSRSILDYSIESKLGEGTYGAVSLARDTSTNDLVALKKLRLSLDTRDADGAETMQGLPISSLREIQLLRSLAANENVVKVLGVAVGKRLDDIYLVMEYCEHDMAYLIDNVISQSRPFSPPEVKCLMWQLLSGLKHLHDSFIIHRDLKMSNLLMTSNGILKIADFGLARKFSVPTRPMTPQVVTLWYRAPEVLFGAKEYTPAIDMWAAGCIFAELIRATALMPGTNEKEQVILMCKTLGTPSEKIWCDFPRLPLSKSYALYQQDHSDLNRIFQHQSEATRSLLKALLVYDPRLRCTVDQALDHPYFVTELPRAVPPVLLPKYPDIRNNDKALSLLVNSSSSANVGKVQRGVGDDKLEEMKRKRDKDDDVVIYDLDLLGAPAFKRFAYD